MSTESDSAARRELAGRIYVEVLGRTIGTPDGGKPGPGIDAEALAVLSLRLAEIFMKVEDKVAAARASTGSFELDASNFAQWSRPSPPEK